MRQLSLALLLLTAACEKHEAPPRPNKPTASNPSGNPLTASGALTVPRTLEVKAGSDKGPSWSVTLEGMGSVAWRYEQRGNREKGARFGTMMIPVER